MFQALKKILQVIVIWKSTWNQNSLFLTCCLAQRGILCSLDTVDVILGSYNYVYLKLCYLAYTHLCLLQLLGKLITIKFLSISSKNLILKPNIN